MHKKQAKPKIVRTLYACICN